MAFAMMENQAVDTVNVRPTLLAPPVKSAFLGNMELIVPMSVTVLTGLAMRESAVTGLAFVIMAGKERIATFLRITRIAFQLSAVDLPLAVVQLVAGDVIVTLVTQETELTVQLSTPASSTMVAAIEMPLVPLT